MANTNILSIIATLREKAEKNKLVIFVGAGVSMNVPGMPSWYGLIEKMAEEINYSRCDNCRHKQECLARGDERCPLAKDYSSDEYLRIPQYVYNNNKLRYNEIIKENIKDIIVDAPLSKAIFELNPSHIITTNYDRLLELSKEIARKQYDVIVYDKDLLSTHHSKYIIKMHGDIQNIDSIVLKEQDYLEYSQKHVLIELFVKALLADHTFLFVGYTLSDYNVKLILSWINYLRTQNNTLISDNSIGYIVQDQKDISKDTIEYFENNSVQVININSFKEIKDIPEQLIQEKGRRLYSFLKTIHDPYLELETFQFETMDKTVDFLSKHIGYDYQFILHLLNVKEYRKIDFMLEVYSYEKYEQLISYLKSNSEKSDLLKQILLNNDIAMLSCSKSEQKIYQIEPEYKNALYADKYYSLYLNNQYVELLQLCEAGKENILKSSFYKSLVIGYRDIHDDYKHIDNEKMNDDETVIYLHNVATLDLLRKNRFRPDSIKNYIGNIVSTKDREVFQRFLDIYEGNTNKRLHMTECLSQLKKDIDNNQISFHSSGAINELYKIKNIAISQYYFYFNNFILLHGISDPKTFLRPYIEAIICANSDKNERPSTVFGFEVNNYKYTITEQDIDIITKFITTKNLFQLVKENKITKFSIGENTRKKLIVLFSNLAKSILQSDAYGYYNSSLSVLMNLLLLILHVDLTEEDKLVLTERIHSILSNGLFNQCYWNVHWSDYRVAQYILGSICKELDSKTNIECINSILEQKRFYDAFVNGDKKNIKYIFSFLLRSEDESGYIEHISNIIDAENVTYKKVILIRLFSSRIKNSEMKIKYTQWLQQHFKDISEEAKVDFIFNGWQILSEENINELLQETLNLYNSRTEGLQLYPSPIESNLQLIYLLVLTDKVTDITILDSMCNDYPHLSFMLHPDKFDYSKIDFSDYMWLNIIQSRKYINVFVAHKDDLIPSIKNRINEGEASETERKLLYHYLLDDEQVW